MAKTVMDLLMEQRAMTGAAPAQPTRTLGLPAMSLPSMATLPPQLSLPQINAPMQPVAPRMPLPSQAMTPGPMTPNVPAMTPKPAPIDYQSNSMPVLMQPQGPMSNGATMPQMVNWGDASNPADFFRADALSMRMPGLLGYGG